jgi:SAM-dependent methyltransferase
MAALLGSHPDIYAIPFETNLFGLIESRSEIERHLSDFATSAETRCVYICEKTPIHVRQLEKVFDYFPEARVILMFRDGRDVVASLKRRTGLLLPGIERWVRDTGLTIRRRSDPRVLVVQYEALIQDSVGTLEEICRYLGLAYDDAMLRFHEDSRNWFFEQEVKASDGVGEPSHRALRNWQVHQPIFDGRGKWRTGLTFEDMVLFNRMAAELMEEIGYYDPARGDIDEPYATIPVETCAVGDQPASDEWQVEPAERPTNKPQISAQCYESILNEEHHSWNGGPWSLGRYYFEGLVSLGLESGDRLLDFGCGAGRLGIPAIRYLKPAHYFGVDADRLSLEAFGQYEIPLHGLSFRAPRLLHDDTGNLAYFDTRFTAIADLYATYHLPHESVKRLYGFFGENLEPGGRIFIPHLPKLSQTELSELGLRVDHAEKRDWPAFLRLTHGEVRKPDEWHVLVRV